jgi:hypothetical protein
MIRQPCRKERQSLLHELVASACMSRAGFYLVDPLGNNVTRFRHVHITLTDLLTCSVVMYFGLFGSTV